MVGFDCGDFAAARPIPRASDGGKRSEIGVFTRVHGMATVQDLTIPKTIVLVGLMGAGKSCIGRRLAAALGVDFVDADAEIEAAAGCTIEQIFESHGEAAFRDGERRVITRLLDGPPRVLASGGGAFVDPATREAIRRAAISVWLRADLDILLRRTGRRNHRPLLKRGDPRAVLRDLMDKRYPVYALADITVDSADGPPEVTLDRVLSALAAYLAAAESRHGNSSRGEEAAK